LTGLGDSSRFGVKDMALTAAGAPVLLFYSDADPADNLTPALKVLLCNTPGCN
jgi:hypothetical protein